MLTDKTRPQEHERSGVREKQSLLDKSINQINKSVKPDEDNSRLYDFLFDFAEAIEQMLGLDEEEPNGD